MADIVVHRPPREPPTAETPVTPRLAPPPVQSRDGSSGWTYALFPVLGSGGLLVMALVGGNPLMLVAGAVFVLGSLGMGLLMWSQVRRRTRGQTGDGRVRYFTHLADVREQLETAATAQRSAARDAHPAPEQLVGLARTTRLWERRTTDDDFLRLRVGVGDVPALAAPVLADPDPTQLPEPAARSAAERLVAAHAAVPDCPVAVPLVSGTTALVGPPRTTRAVARAVLSQLAALHAPDDVRVAVCVAAGGAGGATAREWSWVKWLPHAHHPHADDDGSEHLLIAAGADELLRLLGPELDRRRALRERARGAAPHDDDGPALLVVVDGWLGVPDPLADLEALGVVQLRLVPVPTQVPSGADQVLTVTAPDASGAASLLVDVGGVAGAAVGAVRADLVSLPEAEVLARALAPLRLSQRSARASLTQVTGLMDLLGVADAAALAPADTWAARPERQLLRVPLGVDGEGRPVELDLKESALGGMGPHGLVVGATGSGKSELLRTLVTALAVTHSPEDLALVLVDYKGGATFAGLSGLPHVAGSVTDLEVDPETIRRVASALRGELRRREEVLRASGDLASIREHRQRRLAGADVPAMPHLLVVIDEFAELLAQEPDMVDVFGAIGRLGRSLGVHLLLASQRLEEGKLRGLESHLSYRLALRTFSAQDSRAVIGNADAFELPPTPGSAYLKVDTSTYQRLRVSTVSGPWVEPRQRSAVHTRQVPHRFEAFAPDGRRTAPLPPLGLDLSDPSRRSVLDVVVGRLRDAANSVHQVWLPPLPPQVPLGGVVGGVDVDPLRGLTALSPTRRMRVPVGVVDLPDRQLQQPWQLDLSASGGHLGVAGAPQSGKTTLLRTLVTALAMTHTPDEVQVHCVDLGGGLAGLAALPHVGTVAGRGRPDLVRRVVAAVGALVDEREAATAASEALDAPGAAGPHPGSQLGSRPEVLLVVDGWSALRAEFDDLEVPITDIAIRGAAVGVHVAVASARWFDLRPALRDLLGTRVEFRLGEPADTLLDRAAARAMPPHVPGRMLTMSAAGPRVVQVATLRGQGAFAALARDSTAAWHGPVAPEVRLLPVQLDLADLPGPRHAPEGGGGAGRGERRDRADCGVAIGVRERDLQAARIDLLCGPDPHLLVVGDVGSGKSSTLRTLVRAHTARFTPEELRVVVVDYRRAMLDAVDDAHLSQYCASAPVAAGTIAALAEKLVARMPGPEVTREQLRHRSWWSGPQALVVVDDHDLVATPSSDPLAPLVELLPVAADVGLHLVVARSAGGVGTGLAGPLLRRLRELGTPGLLLSGSREEGVVLHGTRMRQLPPGRALHVSRAAPPSLVQLAWSPVDDADREAGPEKTDTRRAAS